MNGATGKQAMLQQSVLVVAHPDDEILWFSSILAEVGHIVICYLSLPGRQDVTTGRQQVRAEFPLSNVTWLEIPEARVFNTADWRRPQTTDVGLTINHAGRAAAYRENYTTLLQRLRTTLSGCRNVITHNPWGEYGHEDHVQVHRAVMALRAELNYEVWYSNYASDHSLALLTAGLSGFHSDYFALPTDTQLAGRIMDLYRQHKVWTWYADYIWFKEECFVRASDEGATGALAYGSLFPLNYLKIDLATVAEPVKKPRRLARLRAALGLPAGRKR